MSPRTLDNDTFFSHLNAKDGYWEDRFFDRPLTLAPMPMPGIPFLGQELDSSDNRLGPCAISTRREHFFHINLSTTPLFPYLQGVKTH